MLADANTPDDLARIRERAADEDLPDEARCLEILRHRGTLDAVVSHSRAVAAVAAALAAALNERGQHVCAPLIAAGALLHDAARDQPQHAVAGADLLEDMGYARVAAVVRRHMALGDNGGDVGEVEVVYLADKLVAGDRLRRDRRALRRAPRAVRPLPRGAGRGDRAQAGGGGRAGSRRKCVGATGR